MIPARLGSQRIKRKNLKLLNNKPLIEHIIDAAIKVKVFSEIYINSESEIFNNIAKRKNIKFYKRKKQLASNTALNDDFALDFFQNIDCDIMIQLLPTAPLLTADTITNFINTLIQKKLDTLISTKIVRIECIYKNKPINFRSKEKTIPSQDLEPVRAYACGIMGWKKNKFIENMKKYNCAYHGPAGKTSFYDIPEIESVDIDYEQDFKIAESIINSGFIANKQKKSKNIIADKNVERILKKDGVLSNVLNDVNKEKISLLGIINNKPKNASWSHRIIDSKSNSATLIAQMKGEGNRLHYHPEWDEWWYIVKGRWKWEIEGREIIIKKGDVVFIERNKKHKITSLSNDLAIRLAVSRSDVLHVYEK